MTVKVIGDTGAACCCVGGKVVKAIQDKSFDPTWVSKETDIKISGANGNEMTVLGEIQMDLGIRRKMIQVRAAVVTELQPDVILSFTFLKTYGMEIIQKDKADFLALNKLNILVRLEEYQPHQAQLLTLKTQKKKLIKYERKKVGRWVWTEKATQLEKTGDAIIVAPSSEILNGPEATEKAKLYRQISKSGFIIVPCDVQETGTREILELSTDIPVLIPNTYIERENPELWQARREKTRDWIGVRYSTASEAEKYRVELQKALQLKQIKWSDIWKRATRLEKVDEDKNEKLNHILDYFCLISQSDLEDNARSG